MINWVNLTKIMLCCALSTMMTVGHDFVSCVVGAGIVMSNRVFVSDWGFTLGG